MKKMGYFFLISSIVLSLFTGFSAPKKAAALEDVKPGNILADYAGVVRETSPRSDGIYHIDTPRSIEKFKELNINTYYYLVWHERTDWDDLKNEFLPAAKEAGINVVVYLVPPSESTGDRKSYPYTTDYVAWSQAIANLSLQYSNLIGWAIDDFNHNLNIYTPEYMAEMKQTSEAINPNLIFTPQMYTDTLNETFLQTRGEYIDGVILAFRDGIFRNTQVYESAQEQIDSAYAMLKQHNLSLYWMLYASQLSRTPASPSANYVREVVQIALANMKEGKIKGVITYVLKKNFEPEPTDDKAYNDLGYLNFFIGAGVPSAAGNYHQATQDISINKDANNYSLTFQTMDHGPNTFGYHKKQLLVDGQVAWEQDTAEILPDLQWETVTADLSPYLTGKRHAQLTFRFYEAQAVNNFWTYAGFDALQSQGFTVENGDFLDSNHWEFSSNYAGIIGEILQYDENRSLMAYEQTKTSYLTYGLYYSIFESEIDDALKSNLLSNAEKAMTNYFSEQNEKAILQLDQLKRKIKDSTGDKIPMDLAENWETTIEELSQQYQIE
ncbi:hypothetical protein [Fictibacillus sp. NRS-1165]|uniref:hypothetical protein n=1 Tax=Fictibacillus sp. NRS-1165 TaxID=3144463 RepID=UPI003D1E5DF4